MLPTSLLFAAFQTLLSRYTGATDVVVGMNVTDRPSIDGFVEDIAVLAWPAE